MMLIDIGVIYTLFEPREQKHAICVEKFKSINDEFITTVAVLTEAIYFLGESRGWNGQERLWNLIETQALGVHHQTDEDLSRMKYLMEKYQDTPMDFADDSLVTAAEMLKTNKIFTIRYGFFRLSN